jgi:hypothetical protein
VHTYRGDGDSDYLPQPKPVTSRSGPVALASPAPEPAQSPQQHRHYRHHHHTAAAGGSQTSQRWCWVSGRVWAALRQHGISGGRCAGTWGANQRRGSERPSGGAPHTTRASASVRACERAWWCVCGCAWWVWLVRSARRRWGNADGAGARAVGGLGMTRAQALVIASLCLSGRCGCVFGGGLGIDGRLGMVAERGSVRAGGQSCRDGWVGLVGLHAAAEGESWRRMAWRRMAAHCIAASPASFPATTTTVVAENRASIAAGGGRVGWLRDCIEGGTGVLMQCLHALHELDVLCRHGQWTGRCVCVVASSYMVGREVPVLCRECAQSRPGCGLGLAAGGFGGATGAGLAGRARFATGGLGAESRWWGM